VPVILKHFDEQGNSIGSRKAFPSAKRRPGLIMAETAQDRLVEAGEVI